jgi:hypothetical protein
MEHRRKRNTVSGHHYCVECGDDWPCVEVERAAEVKTATTNSDTAHSYVNPYAVETGAAFVTIWPERDASLG